MKIFIYKSLIVFFLFVLAFNVTINYKLSSYEKDLKALTSEDAKEKFKSKIKEEMKKAVEKDKYFTDEEKNLINAFLNKIKEELNN